MSITQSQVIIFGLDWMGIVDIDLLKQYLSISGWQELVRGQKMAKNCQTFPENSKNLRKFNTAEDYTSSNLSQMTKCGFVSLYLVLSELVLGFLGYNQSFMVCIGVRGPPNRIRSPKVFGVHKPLMCLSPSQLQVPPGVGKDINLTK